MNLLLKYYTNKNKYNYVNFTPNDYQLELKSSNNKFVYGLNDLRGTGKTFFCINDSIEKCMMNPGVSILYIGQSLNCVRLAFSKAKEVISINNLESKLLSLNDSKRIAFSNGSRIEFESENRMYTTLGKRYSYIYSDTGNDVNNNDLSVFMTMSGESLKKCYIV